MIVHFCITKHLSKIKMKLKLKTALAVLIILISACDSEDDKVEVSADNVSANIMVISDVHYFDPSLLVNDGTAFQTYLASDRKLLSESEAITESVIASIKSQKPDVLLIPGDLTKDGETVCHQNLKTKLDELRNVGITVLIINGNHDINNPDAVSYDGDSTTPVETVTPDEFKSIWNEYGYSTAIAMDENSLSYVSEPVEGLRILALDVCKYDPQETSGVLKDQTLSWALEQIAIAKAENKAIFGMMHHGLIEHYQGQAQFFSEYLIDNYATASTTLQNAGLEIMFTGHYHANDIVSQTVGDTKLYDIETGSTVTWPCPYRSLNVEGKSISITTNYVTEVDGVTDFQNYAENYIETGLNTLATYMFMSEPFELPQENAQYLAPYFAEGFMAHYAGDETPTTEDLIVIENVSQQNTTIGYALGSLWTDLAPADNTVTITLQ